MGLEAAFNPLSNLRAGDDLIGRWTDVCSWICAIEDGFGKIGTGILVSADLVLTNFHVMEALYGQPGNNANACARFDFREESAKKIVHQGRAVKLANNWNQDLPHSPYGPDDDQDKRTGFDPELVDYAIIRLAEPVGDESVDNPADKNAPQRSWMSLPDAPTTLRIGASIRVLQHPLDAATNATSPRKESAGEITDLLEGDLRLRHNATTFGGSSGGAVLDSNFNLIALHQAGNAGAEWNQAIPISAIVRHIKQKQFGRLVGVKPPPRRFGSVAQSADQLTEVEKARQTERRLHNIKILMDRDDAENLINVARDQDQQAEPGLIHLIVSRTVDSHPNFLERLAHLSLDELGTEARQKREAALLGAAGAKNGQSWAMGNLKWPRKDFPQELALRMIIKDLAEHLRARRRIILEAVIMIGDWDPVRDPQLLKKLAEYLCKEKVKADRMQIFVVCADATLQSAADQYKNDRQKLAAIWTEDRPSGCGAALSLYDVGSSDLLEWCNSLAAVLKVDGQKIRAEVDKALPGGQRVPMLTAEEKVLRQVEPLLKDA